MANELNFPLSPGGQIIVGQVFDENWVQQGANVAMTEVATALYTGAMPASIPYGRYAVLFRLTSGTGEIAGEGEIVWDGAREIKFVPDVLEVLVVAAGGTATVVRTGSTKATGFYDDMVLVVIQNGTGTASGMIDAYSNTNGAFTLTEALPFTPAAGDRAYAMAARTWADVWTKALDIWRKEGLDPDNDTTYRPTKIFTGPEGTPLLEVILTGDCATEVVANRTP